METYLAISISQIQPLQYRKIIQSVDNPKKLLTQSDDFYQHHNIHPTIANKLKAPDEKSILSILKWLRQHDCTLISDQCESYPDQLKQLPCAPPLIYVMGDSQHLRRKHIAVVGSRNASYYGISTTRTFTRGIATHGYGIASGLAIGIDTIAHETCLESIQPTIAIIGLGLDNITPICNRPLAEKIMTLGCIITEMPPQTRYQKQCFPRRNRLISALSIATLIPEASQASGTLITAQYSIDLHRPVMAVPGRIDQPQAGGCHQLIQTGAHLVTHAQDCLDLLSESEKLEQNCSVTS